MKTRKSVMKHKFSEVPHANIPRSIFNRSHGYKTTLDSGYLIPFYVDEALPGDTFNVKETIFARMTTPIVPIMDNLHMDIFYFAVPLRIVWATFQRFMGERLDPDSSINFTMPVVEAPVATGWLAHSVSDYFGIPTGIAELETQSLFHRAYTRIWNEWFRDENLQDRADSSTGNGPDAAASYPLLRRGKRHDYFTSSLLWPQKGDGVELPLGDSAPITGFGSLSTETYDIVNAVVRETDGSGTETYAKSANTQSSDLYLEEDPDNLTYPNLRAGLSSATASTINSLREAFQLQKMAERDARGGTRYTEIVKAHFGVTSPDARLQRPEYLGGSSTPVVIQPVQQTESSDASTPQGNLAAFGTVATQNQGFTKSFVEHSIVMGLVSIRADLSYQQGLPRMFSRSTKYDFYWPALAHLGEQSVLNKEIYAQNDGNDDLVFGYQERWAEYQYYPSKITGKLRSTDANTLEIWHLAQEFVALPTLSDAFIQDTPPIDRILAVQDEPEFIFDAYLEMRTARPMPTYAVPGLIDHF